jgi:uncharacterized DUF497 family protein
VVIEFDAAKDAINRAKHGLSLSVAAEFDATALVLPTYAGSDKARFKMIQETSHGVLTAVVTLRGTVVRVISLRRANRKEERAYGEAIR